MSGGFRTEPVALAEHAASLRDFAGRLGAVCLAAEHPFAPDAYGMLCGFLAGVTAGTERRLAAVVGQLAEVAGWHAEGVTGCATAYRDIDDQLAGGLHVLGGAR